MIATMWYYFRALHGRNDRWLSGRMALALLSGCLLAGGTVIPAPPALWAATQGADRYFDYMADVPLMPGLVELPEKSFLFDKPGGQIVESYAAGDTVSPAEVRRYYARVLPRLGWDKKSDSIYVRGPDKLSLQVEKQAGHTTLRFRLAPRK